MHDIRLQKDFVVRLQRVISMLRFLRVQIHEVCCIRKWLATASKVEHLFAGLYFKGVKSRLVINFTLAFSSGDPIDDFLQNRHNG